MQKGFIGAIGDDFPSLIPLFFAIMIFFASLAYAFTTINERNAYINTYIDSLKIAKTALGNGTVSSHQDFVDKTNKIASTANYVVGIIYREQEELLTLRDVDSEDQVLETIDDATFVCEDDDYFVLNSFDSKYTLSKDGTHITSRHDCEENIYFATSPSVQDQIYSGIQLSELAKNQKVFNYIYPIGLMTPKGMIAAFLVVVVW